MKKYIKNILKNNYIKNLLIDYKKSFRYYNKGLYVITHNTMSFAGEIGTPNTIFQSTSVSGDNTTGDVVEGCKEHALTALGQVKSKKELIGEMSEDLTKLQEQYKKQASDALKYEILRIIILIIAEDVGSSEKRRDTLVYVSDTFPDYYNTVGNIASSRGSVNTNLRNNIYNDYLYAGHSGDREFCEKIGDFF